MRPVVRCLKQTHPRIRAPLVASSSPERYCYYSMRAMLSLYMVEELGFSKPKAIAIFSYFSACVYFSPVLGGYIADSRLGKFSTILSFSIVYVAGIIALTVTSIDRLQWGMFLGLGLIALGSGGIKPCVAAFGAEQFGIGDFSPQDISRYFMAFYASINIGSICSYIITPLVRRYAGYTVAFSLSALFLSLAVIVLVIPRKSYIHVPPTGSMMKEVLRAMCLACALNGGCLATSRLSLLAWCQNCRGARSTAAPKDGYAALDGPDDTLPNPATTVASSPSSNPVLPSPLVSGKARLSDEDPSARIAAAADDGTDSNANPPHWMDKAAGKFDPEVIHGAKAMLGETPFFLALPMFWALFDQNGSAFTLQAKSMELHGLQPDNTLILNPALVLVLIPAYDKIIFPCLEYCGLKLTALRKIGAGMALTAGAFATAALVQTAMDAAADHGDKLSIAWVIPQYVIITMSEILVSTIGQEWMFTQAPKSMKSTMMSMWYVSVGLGDILAGTLYTALGDLPQASFYWLFAFLMAVAACIFVVLAFAYRSQNAPASKAPPATAAAVKDVPPACVAPPAAVLGNSTGNTTRGNERDALLGDGS